MKKFLMILAASASLSVSASAFAQSANQYINLQEARDPAYQAAIRHRSYGSYYGGGSAGYVAGEITYGLAGVLETAIANDRHRPRDGELRILPDGTAVSYDKASKTWRIVHVPVSQPRAVYADRDAYRAGQ